MFNLYKKGDISPRITNEVLETVINTDLIKSSPQKVFAYCYLGLISYFSLNNKYKVSNIKVQEIKRYLGYSELNKKVDYIIKKNGVLEQLGFITDIRNPVAENTKNRIKVPLALDEMKDCHTFNLKLLFKCLENHELGTIGFFIANYIKEFNNGYVYGVRGSINYLSKTLNIPSSTVTNYLEELAKNDLIPRNNVRDHDTLTEMSLYFRGKLNNWKTASLEAHGNKCFVSGKKDDLNIHHIIPFNKIRDYVLNSLNLENKPMREFTATELAEIESVMLEFHKLSVGVPLNEKVHKQFHLKYGNNTTLENLLEFKSNYKM